MRSLSYAFVFLMAGCATPRAATPPPAAPPATATATPAPTPPAPTPAIVAAPEPGSTKEAAIEVCGVPEEYSTLRLMRCPDNNVPHIKRVGNVGGRLPYLPNEPEPDVRLLLSSAPLPPGVRDHHIVDLYELTCENTPKRSVYVDMYHCPAEDQPLQRR